MNTHTNMWVEFANTFGILFAVLAFFLLALYLVRRLSGRFGTRGSVELIKVLSVHHLSPKEKLVLVSVRDESVLIGVSPAGIASLAHFNKISETALEPSQTAAGFQNLLKKSLIKNNTVQDDNVQDDNVQGDNVHKMPLESDSSHSCNDSGKGGMS